MGDGGISFETMMQTFCVTLYACGFIIVGPLTVISLFYILFFTSYYKYVILYFIWYLYDYKTHEKGGRLLSFFRQDFFVWNYIRDYFPIKLVKTCDLDPKQNYFFGYHPHGFIAFGGMVSFSSSACGFDRKFPGIVPRVLGVAGWFRWPLLREIGLSIGCCSVTKTSIDRLFRDGYSVMTPIGGVYETLEARPGDVRLKLKNRKGFVRRAIINGAHLVPVFGFGENEVYNQVRSPEGSILRYLQTIFKKIVGFYPVLVYGRGIVLPFRKPITVVVGKPIPVDTWPNPSDMDIDIIHELYLKELKELFETHKGRYDMHNIQIEFI